MRPVAHALRASPHLPEASVLRAIATWPRWGVPRVVFPLAALARLLPPRAVPDPSRPALQQADGGSLSP